MAGGTSGGPWKQAQVPQPNVAMYQYGYNQVFEQIFQAFEQKYDAEDHLEFATEGYILPNRATYEYEPLFPTISTALRRPPPLPSLAGRKDSNSQMEGNRQQLQGCAGTCRYCSGRQISQ